MRGRTSGPPIGATRTFDQISREIGVPRSTVYRDFDRARDVLSLEIVFAVLPRRVQRQWLQNKIALMGKQA